MNAKEIKGIMMNADQNVFGLRVDKTGFEAGHVFANSHQWLQDADLAEGCEFVAAVGYWDGGELDGVCAIRITASMTVDQIADVLDAMDAYRGAFDDSDTLYLVGGDYCTAGYDPGEIIIRDGTALAVIE